MIELNLISFLLQNPARYGACRDYLSEITIENPILKRCWGVLQNAFAQYTKFPSLSEAQWAVCQTLPQDQAQGYAEMVGYIYSNPVSGVSGEYLKTLLVESEKAKLHDRLRDSKSLDDFNSIGERIRNLKDALTMEEPTWFSPFSQDRIEKPFQALKEVWGEPIPFSLPEMDMWLQGGGQRGELVTIIGLTGGGKSILLLWWCLYQAMQGYYTYYVSFDNVVGELLSRIWCASSGVLMDQFTGTPEEVFSQRLKQFCSRLFPGIQDRFFIEKHPRGTKTVRDIERSIDQIEQKIGRKLDCAYVDYGDCVKPANQKKDPRFQLDETFSSLGALAEAYSILLVTATQANRAAKVLEILDLDSAAESWMKVWHSAIVFALCQTKMEKYNCEARIAVPKARRTRSDYIVPILMDPNNMRVLQHPSKRIEYRAKLDQMEQFHKTEERDRRRKPKTGEVAPPPPVISPLEAVVGELNRQYDIGHLKDEGWRPTLGGAMPEMVRSY